MPIKGLTIDDIDDEKSLIEFGEKFFQASAKGKRKAEHQWLLNIAFIAGDQLSKVNKQTGNLDHVKVEHDPDWMIRIVNNRTLPIYRTMVSKLTKNKPLPSAKAHSREEADIQAARAAMKLEEYHWNLLGLDTKHPEMAGWLVATGNAFYKQFWNPKKGEKIIDLAEMNTEAGLAPDGTPIMNTMEAQENIEFNLGDTDLIIRSPFNIYPQPGKTKLRDMTMFGDTERMTVEEIKETYDKEVQPDGDKRHLKVSIEGTINAGHIMDDGNNDDNSVTVKELYILPNKRFANGLKFRWANGVLLTVEEDCTKISYTHFGLIDIPGQFWYKGIIDDVIPLQRRWNHLLSKIEMHNDYYNDPPFLYDPNAIEIDEWTNEPGLGLPVDGLAGYPGKPVQVVEVPALDPSIFQELNILNEQFEIVPVLNKVSYGKETPNARSGIAINFLQEKDDDIIRPMIENIEGGYAEVFKMDFKLCQDNYEEDRGFAIVGKDNETEWIEFSRANLEANIDVGVEPGSAMPRSKVAQQAMVMDMLKAGFFTDPNTGVPDFAKALKYLEFGSVDDIYSDAALDSNHAKRENERLKTGDFPEVEYWHNHQAHIFEHLRMMKTAEFEGMPPEVQQSTRMHLQMHEQFMQPPQMPAQPGAEGEGGSAGGNDPAAQAQQIDQFIQSIQAQDPELYAQLMALPPEQRMMAAMEVMNTPM